MTVLLLPNIRVTKQTYFFCHVPESSSDVTYWDITKSNKKDGNTIQLKAPIMRAVWWWSCNEIVKISNKIGLYILFSSQMTISHLALYLTLLIIVLGWQRDCGGFIIAWLLLIHFNQLVQIIMELSWIILSKSGGGLSFAGLSVTFAPGPCQMVSTYLFQHFA